MKNKISFISLFILSLANVKAQDSNGHYFDLTTTLHLSVGSIAPSINLQDVNGNTANLEQFKGKTIILDVWATWCAPCRVGLPLLDSLSQSFKEKDVVMIAVCSADSKENFEKYIKDNKSKFKCQFLFDEQGKSLQRTSFRSVYGINGFPTTMVINKAGVIKGYGFNTEEIKLLIQSAL